MDNFKIRYTDEEGDAIIIDDDGGLKEAINHALDLAKNKTKVVIRLSLEKMDTQISSHQNILDDNSNESVVGKCQIASMIVFINYRT